MIRKDKICNKSGKNRNSLIILFIILLFAGLSSYVFAIPNTLTLQGKLTNAAGSSLSGTYTMVFRIYDIADYGYYNITQNISVMNGSGDYNNVLANITYINYTNILWEDNRSVTTDANGIYNVMLHNLSSLNFSDQYYLGIMIGNDNESTPRINLSSSPYAFRANISEDLNKENKYEVSVLNITGNLTVGESSADVLTVVTGRLNISDGNVVIGGNLTLAEKISFSLGAIIDNIVSGFLRINSGLNVTGNVSIAQDTLFVDNTSGRVGIGTTNPYNELTVVGSVGVSGSLNASSINVTGNAYFATSSGNVGIGTTSPDQELHIIGNVTINDSVSQGAIKIDSTNDAILFTGENGSMYMPVYGTDDDLVLYLPFSEGNASMGSTRIYDRSPYGNDGTCNGVAAAFGCNWTTGKYGNALGFDGVDDYVSISDSASLDATDAITLEAWVKLNSLNDASIIWKGGVDSAATSPYRLHITDSAAEIWVSDGSQWHGSDINTPTLSTGEWYHIAGIYGDPYVRIYLDGQLYREKNIGSISILSDGSNVGVGAEILGSISKYFNGSIDEVRIYKRALTAEEIRTHYLRGSGFGASGAITANEFRIVNTSGARTLEINQTGFDVKNTSGDSALYVDKTTSNVGIGITSPTRALHVIGDANISGRLDVGTLNITGVTFSQGDLDVSKSLRVSGGANISGDLGVSGKIGAGTLSPITTLDVKGKANFTGNFSVGETSNILFVDNTSGRVGIGTARPQTALEVIGNINATGNITSGTGTIILDSTHDRIGIGTTQPSHALDVYGNVSIKGNLSVDSNLSVDGSTLFVDSLGNMVGIGDTTPSDALEVVGNVRISGSLNASSLNVTGNAYFATSSGNVGIGTVNPAQTLTVQGRVNISQNLTVNGSLLFADGTSGRVGIGTATPAVTVDILAPSGSASVVNALQLRSSVDYGQVGDGTGLIMGDIAGGYGKINTLVHTVSQTGLVFHTFSAASLGERMRIEGDGDVGIGTASPLSLLHLNKSDNFNTSVTNILTLDHTLANPINSSGGIGVSVLFRANDNASQLYNIGNITAVLYNSTNGSQLGAITFSTVGSDTGDNSFGHLTERMRIDGHGRVGINTSAPTKALHVVGDANISGILDVGTLNITGVTFSQGDLDVSKSLRVSGGANISGDLGVSGKIGAGTLTPITTLDVKGKANFTGNFSIMNASDTIFFVDNTSGRVGIGTTSPIANSILTVAGKVVLGSAPTTAFGYGPSVGDTQIYITSNTAPAANTGTVLSLAGRFRASDNVQSAFGSIAGLKENSLNSDIDSFLAFYTNKESVGGASERMRITSTGNVGIGTASPATILQIAGSSPEIRINDSSGGGYIGLKTNSYVNSDFDIQQNGTSRVYISPPSGNVGIGNTVPNATLDVSGNVYLSAPNPMINMSGPVIRKSGTDIVISD